MVEFVAVRQATVVALAIVGCFFLTTGTIGLLRLPNVYNRLHATSKPTTLGTASMFLAGFVQFGPGGAGLTSLVGIGFLFLTVPTGAHMISRAAQKIGVPFLGGVTWPRAAEDGPRVDQRGVLDAQQGGTVGVGGDIVDEPGSAVEDAEGTGAVEDEGTAEQVADTDAVDDDVTENDSENESNSKTDDSR